MKNFATKTLVILMSVALLSSCGSTFPDRPKQDTINLEDEEIMLPQEYTTKKCAMQDIESLIKPLGRAYILDTVLTADHAASGFAASLECCGDVVLEITTVNDVKFSITIDGVTKKNVLVSSGSSELLIAGGLTEGIHTIEIINETGFIVGSKVDINSITLTGELVKFDTATKPYIEFIGDSITAGYGLSATDEQHFDATLAHPYLTAKLLGADVSILARSGMGVAYSASETNIFENTYPYASETRGQAPYAPTRIPDLVVINLHTNDNYQWYSKGGNKEGDYYNTATFDEKFDGIIQTITTIYGNKVPMLFVFGCMASPSYTLATDRSIELIDGKYTDEGYDIAHVTLPTDRSGKDSHPSVEGAKKQAEALFDYLRANYPELY